MNIFHYPIRILPRFGAQHYVTQSQTEPEPVKLSYTSYENKLQSDKDATEVKDVNVKTGSNGSGLPLVVMHGLFGAKGNWHSICKALTRNIVPPRKIIALDARNHGDSEHSNVHSYEAMASDIKMFLQTEALPQVAFMGHSMGGRAGMYLALRYPELIERLIIVDISPISNSKKLKSMEIYFRALSMCVVPPNVSLSTARASIDQALSTRIPGKAIRAFLLTNLIQKPSGEITWRWNLKSLEENYPNIGLFPITPESGIQYLGPTTFIAGGSSDYILENDHEKIRQLFPNAKFFTIPKAGHWIHSEKPNELIKIVLETLKI